MLCLYVFIWIFKLIVPCTNYDNQFKTKGNVHEKRSIYCLTVICIYFIILLFHQDVILHSDSLSDAKVSINDDTGKTQIEVINTNQDGTYGSYLL